MEALKNSMDPLISAVEERFRKLNIDDHPIKVRKYPEEADTKVITDAILDYGYEYRRYIQSKADIKKMPLLHEFLSSEEHFREMPYNLECWVCGKNG